MTKLDASVDRKHLEKLIKEIPKFPSSKLFELYKSKKIKDCSVFEVTDNENEDTWKAGMFMNGKLLSGNFLVSRKVGRANYLKRKIVAKLLEISQTKWVPTAEGPWLPQRYQNIESDKVLFTAVSKETELENARHDTPKMFDPNEPVE